MVAAELTREILEGPSGPEIAAFFDLDRTLLAGFSDFRLPYVKFPRNPRR